MSTKSLETNKRKRETADEETPEDEKSNELQKEPDDPTDNNTEWVLHLWFIFYSIYFVSYMYTFFGLEMQLALRRQMLLSNSAVRFK